MGKELKSCTGVLLRADLTGHRHPSPSAQKGGMEEVTPKDAHGKINHKNAKKSCPIILFSSKSATERMSTSTVVG